MLPKLALNNFLGKHDGIELDSASIPCPYLSSASLPMRR